MQVVTSVIYLSHVFVDILICRNTPVISMLCYCSFNERNKIINKYNYQESLLFFKEIHLEIPLPPGLPCILPNPWLVVFMMNSSRSAVGATLSDGPICMKGSNGSNGSNRELATVLTHLR